MGTTGASMLLIRPVLRANAWRRHKAHVFVFFIFLVSNIGGQLTPLGDPPLFLGFIHGVPFFWTLRLLPHYLLASAIVLGVFVVLDTVLMRREIDQRPDHEPPHKRTSFRIEGGHNVLLLVGILGAVLLSGVWHTPSFQWFGIHFEYRNLVRDLLIVVIGLLSIASTSRQVRHDNGFTWDAIIEVAYLFFGIFVTIIPVLMILKAGSEGALAGLVARVTEPWQYFWMSGALSSFLDNAPTYLTFTTLALGQLGIDPAQINAVLRGTLALPQAIDVRVLPHGGVGRLGHDGREHLRRQRPQLHGAVDRPRARREDAQLLRVHAVVGAGAHPDVRPAHVRLLLRRRGARPPARWRRTPTQERRRSSRRAPRAAGRDRPRSRRAGASATSTPKTTTQAPPAEQAGDDRAQGEPRQRGPGQEAEPGRVNRRRDRPPADRVRRREGRSHADAEDRQRDRHRPHAGHAPGTRRAPAPPSTILRATTTPGAARASSHSQRWLPTAAPAAVAVNSTPESIATRPGSTPSCCT